MSDEIGLIGLGRMGRNLAANFIENGIKVHGWDSSADVRAEVKGVQSGLFSYDDMAGLVAALPPPRCVMVMVPDGDAVEECLAALSGLLEKGDVLIDSGNSHYRDTHRRQLAFSDKGLDLVGLGISGGPGGARHGPSLMAGGPEKAWRRVGPMLETIAARVGDEPCAGLLGGAAAGHFVKMAHNGIEYAVMQILADIHEILSGGCGMAPERIAETFQVLNRGPTAGFLVEAVERVCASSAGPETGFLIDIVDDRADQNKTGRWAVEAAFDLGVAVPTIAAAVQFRTLSTADRLERAEQDDAAESPPLQPLAAAGILPLLGPAFALAQAVSFAEGFALMGAAQGCLGHALDKRRIALLWRAGCVLRSEMVNRIAASLEAEPECSGLLGADMFRPLVLEGLEPLRQMCSAAIAAGLPVPGLVSALGYAEALGRKRLSTRLIQMQRDYFGGHGFRLVGQEDLVHGPWHGDGG
jgi:6-phosphogluconate dehydrogenase